MSKIIMLCVQYWTLEKSDWNIWKKQRILLILEETRTSNILRPHACNQSCPCQSGLLHILIQTMAQHPNGPVCVLCRRGFQDETLQNRETWVIQRLTLRPDSTLRFHSSLRRYNLRDKNTKSPPESPKKRKRKRGLNPGLSAV